MCVFMDLIAVVVAGFIHLHFIGTPLVLLYIVLFLLMLPVVSRMSIKMQYSQIFVSQMFPAESLGL